MQFPQRTHSKISRVDNTRLAITGHCEPVRLSGVAIPSGKVGAQPPCLPLGEGAPVRTLGRMRVLPIRFRFLKTKNGNRRPQFPSKLILNDIGNIAIENIAESGWYIRIDPLHSAGTPLFHHFKPGVRQLGQAIAGNALFFDQFLQMDRNMAVRTQVDHAA